MAFWLFKQEPDCYSFSDLERDGETVWDGIANALARKHLRTVQVGDRIFFYHTGKEKAIVGEMIVSGPPTSDPKSEDKNAVVVKVKSVRKLASPIKLDQIKKDTLLSKWDLVRLPRLSVVPMTEEQWKRIEEIQKEE